MYVYTDTEPAPLYSWLDYLLCGQNQYKKL
jgi:hypothetical protein